MASNHIESNTLQFSEDMEKPHILVIATGGTIASKEGELGLTPVMSGEELVSDIPGIRNVCTLDVIQLMNIDSTNIVSGSRSVMPLWNITIATMDL